MLTVLVVHTIRSNATGSVSGAHEEDIRRNSAGKIQKIKLQNKLRLNWLSRN